jgi:hypothetical protein
MVLTNAQTLAFFQDADQMAVSAATFAQLATEGITTAGDLAEFGKDDFAALAASLRRPPAIPDPANAGVLVPQAPFVLGAKSLKRLKIAAEAVRYYDSIGRTLTPGNLRYSTTLKSFELQWKSLKERKDNDQPDVPKLTKNLKIIAWSEAFTDFLARVIGVRNAPLTYVIRPEVDVPAEAPPLIARHPHSAEHASVEGELIARLSHASPVFRDDNHAVYHFLEEATRGTVYGKTLKPFTRSKNGREAYLSVISQHAGEDKWNKELKAQESFLQTRLWKGNSNFSLEKFIEQHRSAYISMQQCAEHVNYQLPNETTRVRYLTDNIQNGDPALQAALAIIRGDEAPDGRRNNFESAATYLQPTCPVAKKRKSSGGERGSYTISSAEGKSGLKIARGKTGVEFTYHTGEEYKALTSPQRKELREWRLEQKGGAKDKKKGGGGKRQSDQNTDFSEKKLKTMIASVFREESKKIEAKKEEDATQVSEISTILQSIAHPSTKSTVSSAVSKSSENITAAATELQGILKRGTKPSPAGKKET